MTAKFLSWQELEAEAEQIVDEVMGAVPVSPVVPPPMAPRTTRRLPTPREWVLLSFAGTAVSLAGLMWFSQLSQVRSSTVKSAQVQVVVQPSPTAQKLLKDYQATLVATRANFAQPNQGPADPFSSPFSARQQPTTRYNWSQARRLDIPRFVPPPALMTIPVAPPSLRPLPPLPTLATAPQVFTGLPATAVGETLPTLVGVMGEGNQRTALFQQGTGFKEFKVGDQLSSGWVVQEVSSSQTIMRKGDQTRTVSLGGS
ncbi:hypothetical protein [Candidatus Cyanaurora vandensis]|uniref:hypothetical protein n=1 Tax=Candidatus Cyanaurora vandensis TaxID=2714958 RepID=UPI00257DA594|nr:hypothetical protein [Candidatus Cyanaurora vandensis]